MGQSAGGAGQNAGPTPGQGNGQQGGGFQANGPKSAARRPFGKKTPRTSPGGSAANRGGGGKPAARRPTQAAGPQGPSQPRYNGPSAGGPRSRPVDEPTQIISGIVELGIQKRADGRLRQLNGTLLKQPDDPIIPVNLADRFNIRPGQEVKVEVAIRKGRRPVRDDSHLDFGASGRFSESARGGDGHAVATNVIEIEGMHPDDHRRQPVFEELTSIDPRPRLTLEYPGCPASNRLIDLFCPIGYGTRGLIVSPPKAGKTTLLQDICHGIKHNHPEVEVVALLIDERPEEVTDFRRNVPCLCLASSNDSAVEQHVSLSILAIERAKRVLEAGKHVVVVLDSLTRLGRAFNASRQFSNSGRTMSGGLDSRALEIPKRLFGAARNIEGGGSLTIIASCLVDTGSQADQIIFEEFKGTGNMELILDRSLSEKRVFPAINLAASGTRKEHLLLNEDELKTVTALRRRLMNMPATMQMEQLLKALDRFKTNAQMLTVSS